MELEVVASVVVIGFVHGVLPDHGWPIAATYALDRPRRWLAGVVAGLVLGVGHLISSVALVIAYFWVSGFADLADGPWLQYVAGILLVGLGVREYLHGGHGGIHERGHEHHHGHDHHEHDHHHDHRESERDRDRPVGAAADSSDPAALEGRGSPAHPPGDRAGDAHADGDHAAHERDDHARVDGESSAGLLARVRAALPGGGGHRHLEEEHARQGLYTLGTTALLLGFAHEEPIQILAICVGTAFCLELMLVYSLAVILAILAPTLLLIAGYERHRETVERVTPYLPTITAIVLVGMGLAFLTGVF